MKTSNVSLALPALIFCLTACGGGGGSGGNNGAPVVEVEPNDDIQSARFVAAGRTALGDLGVGDVDYWRFQANQAALLDVDLTAHGLDPAGWAAGPNLRLTLLAEDGTTVLGQFNPANFAHGSIEAGILSAFVPESGSVYLRIEGDNAALAGGSYGFVPRSQAQATSFEQEPVGLIGDNDNAASAELLSDGVLAGHLVAGNEDWFLLETVGPTELTVEAVAYRSGSGSATELLDLELTLFDASGTTELARADDGRFHDPLLWTELQDSGSYALRVGRGLGNAEGAYLLLTERTSVVAPAEVEPNDSTLEASPWAYGATVAGTVDLLDSDYFSVTGSAGDLVHIKVFDAVLAPSRSDQVRVTLLAPDGTTPLLTEQNRAPRPNVVRALLTEDGTHFVHISVDDSPQETAYRLGLERVLSSTFEVEPNDTIEAAPNLGQAVSGTVGSLLDVDTYRFQSGANRLVRFSLQASLEATQADGDFLFTGFGSSLLPRLTILDGSGVELQTLLAPSARGTESLLKPSGGLNLSFRPEEGGTYFLSVQAQGNSSGSLAHYILQRE